MGPGGCDKTDEMIAEWERQVADLRMELLWKKETSLSEQSPDITLDK